MKSFSLSCPIGKVFALVLLVLGLHAGLAGTACAKRGDEPANTPSEPAAPARPLSPLEQALTSRVDFWPKATPAEAKINSALEKKTPLDFQEMPLDEVVEFLKDLHKIPILLDSRAMDDASVKSDAPVTVKLKGVTLRSALRRLLAELGLDFVVKDEVLLITTAAAGKAHLVTRTYPVGDLAASPADFEELRQAIVMGIQPKSWRENRGPGNLSIITKSGSLVISQTPEIHEQVFLLLYALRAANRLTEPAKPGSDAAAVPPKVNNAPPAAEASEAPLSPMQEALRGVGPSWPPKNRLEWEIETATTMEFTDVPLMEVVEYLRDLHGFEIQVDTTDLADPDLESQVPLTFSLQGIPFRKALRLLLSQVGLNYVVKDELVLITTASLASSYLVPRVYPMSDLADTGADLEELRLAIVQGIQPRSWRENRGPGNVAIISKSRSLVISQTREIHEQIAELIQSLRAASRLFDPQQEDRAEDPVSQPRGEPQAAPESAPNRVEVDVD